MKAEIVDGRLVISLKLRKPGPSKSGKSWLVASTRGPQYTDIKMMGEWLRIVANAFIATPGKKKQ